MDRIEDGRYVNSDGRLVPVPGVVAGGEHDQKTHGNWADGAKADWSKWDEAQASAVVAIGESDRGKFWLNADGAFVSPLDRNKTGKQVPMHLAVIPSSMVTSRGPDYKSFAHATKAIRIIVSPSESTVHLWEPTNREQREAISQLVRQTVTLQGDRDDGSSYSIRFMNNSAEDKLGAGLRKIERFISGDQSITPGTELIEFKTQELAETREWVQPESTVLPTHDTRPYLEWAESEEIVTFVAKGTPGWRERWDAYWKEEDK